MTIPARTVWDLKYSRNCLASAGSWYLLGNGRLGFIDMSISVSFFSWTRDGGSDCSALYLCIDMCIDMCADMYMDMGIDMCIDVCIDMCIDMCVGIQAATAVRCTCVQTCVWT